MEALRSAGVSRVLDLRRPGESPTRTRFADDEATYVNLPVEDPADIKRHSGPMVDLYLDMVDAQPEPSRRRSRPSRTPHPGRSSSTAPAASTSPDW